MLTKLTHVANRVRVSCGASPSNMLMVTMYAICDILTVLGVGTFLWSFGWLFRKPQPILPGGEPDLDVAYLYPFPLQQTVPGGEMSFLRGTLSGFREVGSRCEIFSGCPLPVEGYPIHLIPSVRKYFLLREPLCLAYNFRFVYEALKLLRHRKPRILYQRHGRFVFAGVMLSRILRVPLFLEYQNSELWRVLNWDPAHFIFLLKFCEDLSLQGATVGVALSNVLREELVARGMRSDSILVTPAAVDPSKFEPGCGGDKLRSQLGFKPEHLVIGFTGSFSYWHGIPVIERAIIRLLGTELGRNKHENIRFLLVGDGMLLAEFKRSLHNASCGSFVTFTGAVPHERVRDLLDATDILLSPHVPLQGGQRFFGSPSKLFEYMAMGKAIIASDLEQLSEVLTHMETALLIPPEDDAALADAILYLIDNQLLRQTLGKNARVAVLSHHTWKLNAARLLSKSIVPSHAEQSVEMTALIS
jgi:glycosyltransferase involved in cell wall biosynthesis